jgi:hypothetical protein
LIRRVGFCLDALETARIDLLDLRDDLGRAGGEARL